MPTGRVHLSTGRVACRSDRRVDPKLLELRTGESAMITHLRQALAQGEDGP